MKLFHKLLIFIFLFNQVYIISNSKTDNKIINKIINFGNDNANQILSLNMFNNDILFISTSFESNNKTNKDIENKNIYVYGLKSTGEEIFNDNGSNFKTIKSSYSILSLNGVNLKIDGTEYPFICSYTDCYLIDYENDITYYKNLISCLNYTETNLENIYQFINFPIINLNKGNKILFAIRFNETINLSIINIKSKNLSSEIISNKHTNEKIKMENTEILSCFITEKKIIECLYVDESKYYKVAIFNESLNFLDVINLDEEQKIPEINSNDYYYYCIHLKKEIGVFTYYIEGGDNKSIYLYLQINELIFNNNNYIFKRFKKENKININLNNSSNIDIIKSGISNEYLMKISDNKFSYVYYSYSDDPNYADIILVIFDLYNNDENLLIKYYRINLPSIGIYTNSNSFYNLNTFMYKSFLGVEFLCYLTNINARKSYYIIFGYFDQETKEILLNINEKFEWKIIDDINIYNNIFGYEIFYKIKSIHDSFKNIEIYSINLNKEIKIDEIIDYNDTLLFDFTNVDVKNDNNIFFEISVLILEYGYNKSMSLCDKFEIYGEDPNLYIERKIIDEIIYKVKLNINCYSTCQTCNYIGFKNSNQKCLSCKENKNLCFMENEGNCYDISVYNFYKSNSDILNKIKCIPFGEHCNNEYPLEIKKTKECVKECNFEDLINNNIIPSNMPNSINITFDVIYKKIKEGQLDEEIKKQILINGYNITIEVTTSSNQQYYINNNIKSNLSIIDLSECEKKLGLNKSLIILKMDINRNDSCVPQVEYLIIDPYSHKKADLSLCEDIKVDIFIPFNISKEDLNLYNYLNDQGYNMFDPNDEFYNDICTPFNSYNNTDVLIRDRKKDFFNNEYSFCEEGCEFDTINTNLNKVKCICEIKKEIKTDTKFSTTKLLDNFYKIGSYSNFKVIICYKLVFSKIGQKYNYGSYIELIIIFLFIVVMIINIITKTKRMNKILEKVLGQQTIIINLNINRNKNPNKIPVKKSYDFKLENPNNNIKKIKKEITIIKNKRKLFTTEQKNIKNPIIIHSPNLSKRTRLKKITKKLNNNSLINSRRKSHQIKNILPFPPKKINYKEIKIENTNKLNNNNENSLSKQSIYILKEQGNYSLNKKVLDINGDKKKEEISEIVIKNIEKENRKNYFSNEELNSLEYKYALEIDDRSYIQYYWSLLKLKHLIIFTFITNDDYNIFLLKLGFFLISLSLYFAVNTMFFSDDSIHKNYEEEGKYNFIYQIPQLLYSTIISAITNIILKKLSLSENDILKIKENLDIGKAREESKKVKRCLKIKVILFIIIGLIFLIFFWYYISCFCCVFKNTQIPLLKDTIICYGLSMLYPFGLNLLPGLLRIPSLKKNDRKTLYIISRILSFI